MFRKRRTLAEVGLDGEALEAAAPPSREPFQQKERLDELAAAVAGLNPIQRDVVHLRFQQELPLADIAAALSLPLNTVKSHLKRGVERLRTAMEKGEDV